jgi:hypothetical protein
MKTGPGGDEALHEQTAAYDTHELAPPDVYDPVLEEYEKHVDRTLLRENLKLTPAQRVQKTQQFIESRQRWANHTDVEGDNS